jgi:molybdopterin-guanine dinucleotide biosynthesis protein A
MQHLLELLRLAGAFSTRCAVTIDREDKVHPLCAVYSTDCLPQVSRALDENRLRLLDLVKDLEPMFVRCTQPIRNVNTIEEWSSAAV